MFKRGIKLLVSSLVYTSDIVFAAAGRLVGRTPRPKAVVLYYHGISDSERPRFERQMRLLARCSTPLDCAQPALNGCPRYVGVTFDDGFVSVIENALPVLKALNIPAIMFVPTGSLGMSPAWVKTGPLKGRKEQVLTPDQLREIASDPLVTIGSHTISHPRLAQLPPEEASRELRESKLTLETILSRPVSLFSFPHGSFGKRDLQLAGQAGYSRTFGIHPSLAFGRDDEFITGRVAADPNDWPLEFFLKLAGAYRWQTRFGKQTDAH